MKYNIEYEEKITRINTITIEVDSEEDGDDIVDDLYCNVPDYDHPDDIFDDLREMGVEVVETREGAEDCEYEIL
jgi:hypothetical protein